MRRSALVAAPLLASTAALLLNGCHHGPEMQRCVDAQNRIVDPALCHVSSSPGAHGGGFYHFYYGGAGNYSPGTVVSGGSTSPASGHSYSTTTGTARGGFGSSFSGGGDAEGGGHGGGAHGGGAGE